ncbi:MATE family efflux transporter [Erysipelothrix tonsillarum]|uniref:MATE family efflux transporter n=1 Tax=Erysipelothrix tonsillarum TaxID=38402 RepID=UPI000382CEAB|nr:MATE family efflux transporter [Erysipelothrix tonsillarum]
MEYLELSNKKIITRYAIPQMIGLIFNSIYFIIDGIFIGKKLGPDSLAAAGIAIPVVEIMIALAMMISVGAGVMVSAAIGYKDYKKANTLFNQANLITAILSIAIVILGNIFINQLAQILGATNLIFEDTKLYLRYFITASPFLLFSFTLSTFARNDNAPKLAMWALIIGSISNIILDWFFMYPLNMGLSGAALATALGPIFSVLILLPHFIFKKGLLSFKLTKVYFKDMFAIFSKGLSAFITNFSIGFVTLLYNMTINHHHLGEITLSSYVIIGYISLIALTSFLGISQGIQPAISFYSGCNEHNRLKSLSRSGIIFNLTLGFIYTVFIFLFAPFIINIFTNESSLVFLTSSLSTKYFLNLPFAAVNIAITTLLQALDYQKESTIISLMRSTLPLILF